MKKYSSLALALLLSLASCSPAKDVPSTEAGDSTLSQSVEATTQEATLQEATLPETTPVETTKVETTPAETDPVKMEGVEVTIFCPSWGVYYLVDSGRPLQIQFEKWYEYTKKFDDWSSARRGDFAEIRADITAYPDGTWEVDRITNKKITSDYSSVIQKDIIPELGREEASSLHYYKTEDDTYIVFRDEKGNHLFGGPGEALGVIPAGYMQDGRLTAEAIELFLDPSKAVAEEVSLKATRLTQGMRDELTSEGLSDAFIAAYEEFAVKLTQVMLDRSEEGSNFLISPISVMTCMAMVANGADGNTLAQIETALGGTLSLEEINSGLQSWYAYCEKYAPKSLSFANSIWIDQEENIASRIREGFLQRSVNCFDADVYSTPFDSQGLADINNWCRSKTFGMIPNILDRFEPETAIVLLNTLALDAQWILPFDPEATTEREFTNSKGDTETVDTMFGDGECSYWNWDLASEYGYCYGTARSFKDVPLMFAAFMAPTQDESAEAYLKRIDAKTLSDLFQEWKENGEPGYEAIEMLMPKFGFENDHDLKTPLEDLGITDVFVSGKADLSGMTGDRSLFINRALHKTSIEVNERGTRIAAGAASSGGYGECIDFNRPFVFVIYDTNYGLPIFIGLVNHIK